MKIRYSFLLFTMILGSLVVDSVRAEGVRTKVVMVAAEYLYHSRETLPVFREALQKKYPMIDWVVLMRPEDPKQQTIPGLEAIAQADLVVLMMRRMTLPEAELNQFKAYLAGGHPLIGLRTASHAFENWAEFDKKVLGGNYQNHYDNQFRPVLTVAGSAGHSILKGVSGWTSSGSLYKNMPLPAESQVLLRGTIEGHPSEPVAWTHSYGTNRIFYTSLGHPDDFKEPNFTTLLENAIFWALGDKAPKPASVLIPEGMQRVDVAEFDRLRLATKAVILDVRTPEEFAAGHIPGALNIDVNEPDFEEKVKHLDLNQPYLVHCAAGGRSARACTKMSRLKFKTLVDLAPGFNGWKAAGKPIEK